MIQDTITRMTDPEELDAEQDEILYSTLDYFPGEPESQEPPAVTNREIDNYF